MRSLRPTPAGAGRDIDELRSKTTSVRLSFRIDAVNRCGSMLLAQPVSQLMLVGMSSGFAARNEISVDDDVPDRPIPPWHFADPDKLGGCSLNAPRIRIANAARQTTKVSSPPLSRACRDRSSRAAKAISQDNCDPLVFAVAMTPAVETER
jgi:hypothetical protein